MHSNFRHNPMPNRSRQTGAFLLVVMAFLIAAGGAMLYAMSNVSSVSSTTTTLAHNSNMALAAAQSGLKYCLVANCPPPLTVMSFNGIPCTIEVSDGGCNCGTIAVGAICTVTSRAYCPNANDPYRGARKLSIQAQKTTGTCQIIPASRQVLPLP